MFKEPIILNNQHSHYDCVQQSRTLQCKKLYITEQQHIYKYTIIQLLVQQQKI